MGTVAAGRPPKSPLARNDVMGASQGIPVPSPANPRDASPLWGSPGEDPAVGIGSLGDAGGAERAAPSPRGGGLGARGRAAHREPGTALPVFTRFQWDGASCSGAGASSTTPSGGDAGSPPAPQIPGGSSSPRAGFWGAGWAHVPVPGGGTPHPTSRLSAVTPARVTSPHAEGCSLRLASHDLMEQIFLFPRQRAMGPRGAGLAGSELPLGLTWGAGSPLPGPGIHPERGCARCAPTLRGGIPPDPIPALAWDIPPGLAMVVAGIWGHLQRREGLAQKSTQQMPGEQPGPSWHHGVAGVAPMGPGWLPAPSCSVGGGNRFPAVLTVRGKVPARGEKPVEQSRESQGRAAPRHRDGRSCTEPAPPRCEEPGTAPTAPQHPVPTGFWLCGAGSGLAEHPPAGLRWLRGPSPLFPSIPPPPWGTREQPALLPRC